MFSYCYSNLKFKQIDKYIAGSQAHCSCQNLVISVLQLTTSPVVPNTNSQHSFALLAPPNIEFGPEYFEGLTVKAGDTMKLKVSIMGRPNPKVVWFRDGVEITKKMMDIINLPGSSTLFVRDADRTHKGLYSLEATNGSGTKKAKINVQVQGV